VPGTIIGVGQAFKAINPSCKVVALEPSKSCTILCGEIAKHLIEGIADRFVPGIIQRHRTLLDEVVTVESADAVREMRRLAREHGIFVGPSSGAHLIAARKLRDWHKVEHVATFFCGEGKKYINVYWL
jgi:cysteine synthase A